MEKKYERKKALVKINVHIITLFKLIPRLLTSAT